MLLDLGRLLIKCNKKVNNFSRIHKKRNPKVPLRERCNLAYNTNLADSCK